MSGDDRGIRTVGFLGLDDDLGLPMATALAEAGYELHVWARGEESLEPLRGTHHVEHVSAADLGAACDLVGLCVADDDAVLHLASDGLLTAMRAGSVLVNHGTGLPRNADRLGRTASEHRVDVLDAPVSGGRPAAEKRRLTTYVGGSEELVARCTPVFRAFSAHVVHAGGPGTGQMIKLLNNALLFANQAANADVVELAVRVGLDPVTLVEGVRLGSGSSAALELLGTVFTPDTIDRAVELSVLDMRMFDDAMRDAGVSARQVSDRGMSGVRRLPDLVRRLDSSR